MNNQETFNKLCDYFDVPTKIHLQEFKDDEGLEEYKWLRTNVEDSCEALDIILKKEVRIDFIKSTAECKFYNKAVKMVWDYEEKQYGPRLLTETEYARIKESFCY